MDRGLIAGYPIAPACEEGHNQILRKQVHVDFGARSIPESESFVK
jgi:hypothetical protein